MMYKYEYPEKFKDYIKPDFEKYSGNIVIYGASTRGAVVAHAFKQRGIKFICFCDSDLKKHGTEFRGHAVISPEEMKAKYPDVAIVIATIHHETVYEKVVSMGYTIVLDCVSLFLAIELGDFDFPMQMQQLRRFNDFYLDRMASILNNVPDGDAKLNIIVTERCNLRCRDCLSMMPYHESPKDHDWDEMKIAIDRLIECLPTATACAISGGEPFMYGHLADAIDTLVSYESMEKVYITTNGTLLPDAKAIKSMQNKKVIVRISDYGKLSKKMNELLSLCEEKYIVAERTYQYNWQRVGIEKNDYSTDELKQQFKNCCRNECFANLSKGKLYICSFLPHALDIGAIPEDTEACIDLLAQPYDSEEIRNRILKFRSLEYINSCRYCRSRSWKSETVPIAIQATERLVCKKYI